MLTLSLTLLVVRAHTFQSGFCSCNNGYGGSTVERWRARAQHVPDRSHVFQAIDHDDFLWVGDVWVGNAALDKQAVVGGFVMLHSCQDGVAETRPVGGVKQFG